MTKNHLLKRKFFENVLKSGTDAIHHQQPPPPKRVNVRQHDNPARPTIGGLSVHTGVPSSGHTDIQRFMKTLVEGDRVPTENMSTVTSCVTNPSLDCSNSISYAEAKELLESSLSSTDSEAYRLFTFLKSI
jgi:hypothetical protein